jgi:hypothetical protein
MKVKTRNGSGVALWRGVRVLAAATAVTLLVAACGGDTECATEAPFEGRTDVGKCAGEGGGGSGGGGGGSGGGAQTTVGLTLKLTDSNGAATTAVITGQPLRAQAVLMRNGQPVAGEIVQFSIEQAVELVRIDPVAGSLLTADDGTAIVTVSSLGASTGAGTLKATAKIGDETVTAGANFFASGSSSTPPASLSLGAVKISSASVSAYGTTGVEVQVLQNGAPYTSPVTVNFTSSCPAGKASVTPSAATAPSGMAVGTFVDNGCAQTADATVNITASIATDSKSGSMLVKAPTTGSLRFVSVEPSDKSITLRGQGGNGRQENATVTFKLVDVAGQGGAMRTSASTCHTSVELNLDGFSPVSPPSQMGSTAVCGTDPLSQIRYMKRTTADGTVAVQVNSGTVPTPVRVRARSLYPSTASAPLESFSDTLSVSTGLPLQRSFSLSVDKANIDGGNFDGEIATLTVRLADQFSNPVPDGTVVNFIGSGAAVCTADNGSCKTTNGACSCQVVSQARRPADNRVVVTAYAVGMEDFDDRNGDNLYTNGVDGFDLNRQDLGDAYVDANKDGVYGDGSTAAPTNPTINGDTDIPIPYQRNNLITVKGDGVRGTAHIRASTVIYLSQASSAGDPTVVVPLSSLSRSYSLSGGTSSGPFVRLKPNCPKDTPVPQATVFAMLDDGIGNPMAAGTSQGDADASSNISPAGFRPSSVLAIGTRAPSPGMDLPNTAKDPTWTRVAENSNVPSAHSITVRGVEDKCSGDASFALEVKSPRGGSAGALVLYEGDSRISTSRAAFDVRYVDNQWNFTATPAAGRKVDVVLPDGWVGSAATEPSKLEIDWGDGSVTTPIDLPLTAASRSQQHPYLPSFAGPEATVTVRILSGATTVDSKSNTVVITP